MPRKINMVVDPKIAPQKPKETEKISSPPPQPAPLKEEDELDYEAIEERERELDELITAFVCDLVGAEDPDERDMVGFGIQSELEELKDELEGILATHGFFMYRPTIVTDEEGNEVIVNNSYE